MTRLLKYNEAISEALVQAMERNPKIFVMGQGVDDANGAFGTTRAAYKKFGGERVFDLPLSENGITGWGVGASLVGMRPVMVHLRNDFLMLAMDQLVNHAAKWAYMHGGTAHAPIVIRACIGRGWGQAAQHSQSLQALLAHIPGLKVIMPATPYDAKGMLLQSFREQSPVISLEHRWLFDETGDVPEEYYTVPFGKACVIKEGTDITVVAVSYMLHEAIEAHEKLRKEGISAEVLDLRSVKPLDEEGVLASVRKTGRLVIADTGSKSFGISAEIAALVAEKGFASLKAPIARVASPDTPTPGSAELEKYFYPSALDIALVARNVFQKKAFEQRKFFGGPQKKFSGPF